MVTFDVGVVGAGRVGLAAAACLAHVGGVAGLRRGAPSLGISASLKTSAPASPCW